MKFLALLVLALAAMKSFPSSVRSPGIQQRMQQLRCRADELPDEDAFVKKKFAQGKLSASEMYDGSRTVKKGKTKSRVRQGIVKVDDRNHSRHILRKLRREPTRRLPRPYHIKIPLWDRDAAKQIMGEVAVLNPTKSCIAGSRLVLKWSFCSRMLNNSRSWMMSLLLASG